MRKLGIMFRMGLLGAVAAVVLAGTVPEAVAARNPAKASVRCRKAIGQSIVRLVTAGLKTIQTCHARRLKGRASGDCNALSGDAGSYGAARARAVAVIGNACKGSPVLENYPPGALTASSSPVYMEIERLLEESGEQLQGSPTFDGDKASIKQHTKCHGMLGKGRTLVVQAVLRAAVRCQQRRDKKAQTFGPIDPSCLVGAGGAGNRAARQIQRACDSLDGAEVGSCSGLPACLVSATETTGRGLARLTFGGPTQCGNGLQELGEECDDGNTSSNDSCTAVCTLPECGDGIVSPGEECDLGLNNSQTGECRPGCVQNVCGDGFQNPAVEECDDGNTAPGDGCSANCTLEPTTCGPAGAVATIEFQYPVGLVSTENISIVELEVGYPATVSIPGSGGDRSVRSRVTSLLGPAFSINPSDVDTNGDGTDDQVDTLVQGAVPPGPVESIQFDCAPGAELRPADFACRIGDFLDMQTHPFSDEIRNQARCQVTRLESVFTTTTTTTSTSITIPPPPPTTSTTIPARCGDGIVQAPETCDDGNNENFDSCPSACRIEPCEVTTTPVPATLVVSTPDVRNLKIELDYPEGKVELPGEDFSPDVTPLVGGTFQPFDLGSGPVPPGHGYALRVIAADAFNFGQQNIATLNFVACAGAQPPVPSDFQCFVREAGSETGSVPGVTCGVTIP